jgi:transcriptional regulator with XRE-family HTH domain
MLIDQTLTEYESWDLTMPMLPQCSRLYRIDPCGMGTPLVESLTGYITRLAEAHGVSAGILYLKEIDRVVKKGNIFSFRLTGHAGYPTHTINGLGVTATDFVRALETLTNRTDLRYLTLLPWNNVLSPRALQRRVRAWCPSCLCQWRDAEQPIYEPLLWRIGVVTLCPSHRQPLCQVCPHCQHQIGPLDPRTRPGYCSRCSGWLAPVTADELSTREPVSDDDLAWSLWIGATVGDLLAAGSERSSPLTRENLSQSITSCMNQLTGGDRSAFARLLQVGENAVRNWQSGKRLPRLPLILEMCHSLGTSLLDFLSGACVVSDRKVIDRFLRRDDDQHQRLSYPRRGQRIKAIDVERALHIALKENPPPSMRQVIKRLNHSAYTIYRHFPELCRAISERFTDYRRIRSAVRRELARAEVRVLAYELHARGIKITRNNMRPLLTSSDYWNLPEGRAALQEVKRELGLCNFRTPNE